MIEIKDQKLPEDIKTKWLEALRSGEYKQGVKQLHNSIYNTYCCLGVLGHICGYTNEKLATNSVLWGGDYENVPKIVQGAWWDNEVVNILTQMNDAGQSFLDIANWIEENL